MRYCCDKRIDELIAGLVREGWQYSRGKHGKLRTPSGERFVTVPCTPSDYRTFQNLCRDIRRQMAMTPHHLDKFQAIAPHSSRTLATPSTPRVSIIPATLNR